MEQARSQVFPWKWNTEVSRLARVNEPVKARLLVLLPRRARKPRLRQSIAGSGRFPHLTITIAREGANWWLFRSPITRATPAVSTGFHARGCRRWQRTPAQGGGDAKAAGG